MLTNLLVGIYSKLKILIRFVHPCRGTEISQTSITNYSEISVAYVGCGCVHSHWLCLLELCFFCRYPLLPMRLCWFSPTATICNGLIPRWFQVWHILCVVKIYYLDNFWQARKLNKEDAMDRSKWRKVIKEARWSGWVWVGECFFWYRPARVVPDQRPFNSRRRCCCCCLTVFSCSTCVLFFIWYNLCIQFWGNCQSHLHCE